MGRNKRHSPIEADAAAALLAAGIAGGVSGVSGDGQTGTAAAQRGAAGVSLLPAEQADAQERDTIEAPPKLPRPENFVTEEERPDDPDNCHPFLREKLETLPACPGVYLMRDKRHRVIYVGKSACLKNRVRSYFHSHNLSERIKWMVSLVRNFDIITVNTEIEALLLENNLIKKHRPYFNVMFRDDKSYPALELTTFEDYPRLRIVHTQSRLRGTVFGPYADASALKRTKKLLQKMFKIRPCRENLSKPLKRSCLYYHIGMCGAPCTGSISKEDYAVNIEMVKQFLNGHIGSLVSKLKAQMAAEAQKLNYERCAELRDAIADLKTLTDRQEIVFERDSDEDYISLAFDAEGSLCCALVWQIREGKLQGQQSFILNARLGGDLKSDTAEFIQQYYAGGSRPPQTICLQEMPDNADLLCEWLSGLNGRKVSLQVPQRGERSHLMRKTAENARRCLEEEMHSPSRLTTRQQAVTELKEALHLPRLPLRMECYDISNIQGKYSVASMTVFEHGLPHRSHYRKFKIQGMDTPNDFASMNQVLRRRLSHIPKDDFGSADAPFHPDGGDGAAAEKSDASLECVPDLIIVDGGLGQLGEAVEVLREMGLEGKICLAGLAKKEEELFVPGSSRPTLLPVNSNAYNMVTHLRNEAHRFAITFHRSLRGKGMLHSVLDDVPGLGPKGRKLLRRRFKTLAELRAATVAELQEVKGIGPKTAVKIAACLKEKGADSRAAEQENE